MRPGSAMARLKGKKLDFQHFCLVHTQIYMNQSSLLAASFKSLLSDIQNVSACCSLRHLVQYMYMGQYQIAVHFDVHAYNSENINDTTTKVVSMSRGEHFLT